MKTDDFIYTNAPTEISKSLERAKIITNFDITPEGIKSFEEERKEKTIIIYTANERTIEKST